MIQSARLDPPIRSHPATGPDRATRLEDIETGPLVRGVVTRFLEETPAYKRLSPEKQNQLALSMNRVCHAAAELLKEEALQEEQLEAARRNDVAASVMSIASAPTALGAPARAQAAGDAFGGQATASIGRTTRQVLNAVSFPRFVGELINGVFKAMLDSNQQQMDAYVDLLNNVAATTDGFADAHFGADRARLWLAEKYPGSFETEAEGGDAWDESAPTEVRLRLKPNAEMPPEGTLRTDLGLPEGESIPRGDPESLVPLVRRALAKQKQQMLSSMVMMGMQRIVVESGKIQAAMRFHIDTRSAAQADEGSRFDFQNQLKASGKYGFGPWGVSASMTNTIGYCSTQQTQTTEEVNTDLDLNSSVELNFRTDYLPLDRMAASDRVSLIRANTLNPAAESKAAEAAREKRSKEAAASDAARKKKLDKELTPKKTTAAKGMSLAEGVSGDRTAAQPVAEADHQDVEEYQDMQTQTRMRRMPMGMPQAAGRRETCIHRERIQHEDPPNFPINLPEGGSGRFKAVFTVPSDLKFSSWRMKVKELSPGATYKVEGAPRKGAAGQREIRGTWSHLPYGKVDLELCVYASPDGEADPWTVFVDAPHWKEQAEEAIGQGVPLNLGVQGKKAELLHQAIVQLQAKQAAEKIARPMVDPIITPTVVITATIIFGAIAIVGMVGLFLLVKHAIDSGYDIKDTGYKFSAGEGPLKQEHELTFNLSPPGK